MLHHLTMCAGTIRLRTSSLVPKTIEMSSPSTSLLNLPSAPNIALSMLALVSIAACASALVGMTRQILGQAIATRLMAAAWLTFVINVRADEFAGASGGRLRNSATVALGGVAALFVRVDKRLTAGWYFLWVFGCVSLMSSGRLLYSAFPAPATGRW